MITVCLVPDINGVATNNRNNNRVRTVCPRNCLNGVPATCSTTIVLFSAQSGSGENGAAKHNLNTIVVCLNGFAATLKQKNKHTTTMFGYGLVPVRRALTKQTNKTPVVSSMVWPRLAHTQNNSCRLRLCYG